MPPPRLPTPPIPPPGAVPSPVATRGDEDPMSPTVMLQAYLRSQGKPLTADNMQRVLMENARGSVDIPGLVNDTPGTNPGVGQGGNIAGRVEQAPSRGGRLPTPPIPPDNPPPAAGADTTNQPAIPQSITDIIDPRVLGPAILAGASAGTGMWLGGRRPPPPNARADTSAPPAGRGGGGNAIEGPPEMLRLPAPTPALPAPAQTGNRFDIATGASTTPSPLDAALAQAVAPAAGMQPSATGPATSISPQGTPDVLPRPPMPNRVNAPPPDVVPPGMMRTPSGGLTNIPSPGFRAQPRGAGRMRLRF